MKKYIFTIMAALLILTQAAFGQVASNRVYYQIQVVDEFMQPVTSPAITQISVQNESGVAVAVYSTKTGSTEVGSTGVITSGLSDGMTEFWYGDTAIDLTVSNGTVEYEIESYDCRTRRFMLPNFLTSMSSTSYGQSQTIDFTYGSFIIRANAVNTIQFVPDNDGAQFLVGSGTYNSDFYLYASSSDYIFYDEGNALLNMVDIDIEHDDDAYQYWGSDQDISIKYDNSGDDLDILGDDSEIAIGATGAGLDVIIWGETAGDYAYFDEDNNELYMADYDIQGDDDFDLIFGTNDDFSMYSDTANILEFDPGTAGNEIRFGTAATDAVDLTWYGDTSGDTAAFDEENCEILLTDIDLQLDDAADLIFGTGDDFTIDSDTAKTLDILPGAATDDYIVNVGLDQSGVDFKVFGATTGEYWSFDAGADSVLANLGNVSYTTVDAEANQFKVDATGTVAGYAIVFETTNGGVRINADNADNGDISFEAADDLTLDVVGDILLTGSTAQTIVVEGTADDYETTISVTDPTVDSTVTIPTSSSGTILVPHYIAYTSSQSVYATPCWGGIFTNTGVSDAIELELPSAVAGMRVTAVSTVACPITLDPDASDIIVLPGSGLLDAGDKVTSGTTVGSMITLHAIDTTYWVVTAAEYTWSDGGA